MARTSPSAIVGHPPNAGIFHDVLKFESGNWVVKGRAVPGSEPNGLHEDRVAMMVDDGSVPEFSRYGGYVAIGNRLAGMSDEVSGKEIAAHPYLGAKLKQDEPTKYLPATRKSIDDWSSVVPEDELKAQRAAGYFLDLWHWRAGRSNPVNISDDQLVAEGRLSDTGKSPYATNWDGEKKQPRLMFDAVKAGQTALKWADIAAGRITQDSTYALREDIAAPFDPAAGWKDGDTIPRRILRPADGSRADIKVLGKARWDKGFWDVTLTRKMDTGAPLEDKILRDRGIYSVAFCRPSASHRRALALCLSAIDRRPRPRRGYHCGALHRRHTHLDPPRQGRHAVLPRPGDLGSYQQPTPCRLRQSQSRRPRKIPALRSRTRQLRRRDGIQRRHLSSVVAHHAARRPADRRLRLRHQHHTQEPDGSLIMAAYHIVLVHFPIALWMTATLAILIRAFSNGPLAIAIDRALVPLLTIGLISGVLALAVGSQVWPWDTVSTSPMGRNHMLWAVWTTAYWTLMLITRWVQGSAVWHGPGRWIMAGLAIIGAGLLGITGTLGGHLSGKYTDLAIVLKNIGWDVHRTFYVPDITLLALIAATLLLFIIGWRSAAASSK